MHNPYYALRCLSPNAIAKAVELHINPASSNFKRMSDPRRKDYYLFVSIDTDGYVLSTDLRRLDAIQELMAKIDSTVVIVE